MKITVIGNICQTLPTAALAVVGKKSMKMDFGNLSTGLPKPEKHTGREGGKLGYDRSPEQAEWNPVLLRWRDGTRTRDG